MSQPYRIELVNFWPMDHGERYVALCDHQARLIRVSRLASADDQAVALREAIHAAESESSPAPIIFQRVPVRGEVA